MRERFLFVFLFLLPSLTSAFTIQKTKNGDDFLWGDSKVYIYVNPSNSSSIGAHTILSKVRSGVRNWTIDNILEFEVRETTTSSQQMRNDIYFTSDASYFSGASVLAITENSYNESTGRIIEANIVIKDTVVFSNNPNETPYIWRCYNA